MYRPSIKQLSYLIAIHENGSFISAADDCAVTQSTLSAGIKELETNLDRQLIIRNRKKATLTPLGLEILDKAKDILAQTDQIVMRSKALKEPLSGPLRLGIIPTIAPYMLPSLLPKLESEFPKLEPHLYEDLTENLLEQLRKSQIDVALMAFPYDTPEIAQRILFEEPFLLAASEKTKAPTKDATRIKDLEPEKLLLLEDGHCLRDHALSACDIQLPRSRKTFSATSLPTLIQMVRAGFGMTLLPEMACKPDIIPNGIKLLPFADKRPPTRQIGLCWRNKDLRADDYEILAKSLL